MLYIDSKAGGFTTTAGFTDKSDPLHRAISGINTDSTQRATLTFGEGFTPDYAIALDAGFAGVYELMDSMDHTYIASGNLTPVGNASSPTFSFSISKLDIGITGELAFNFLGTYISETGYRAAEAIGDSMAGFSQGWNPYTTVSYNTYTGSSLPVKLSDFRAAGERNNVILNWSVAQEFGIDNYQIQRSGDGVRFETIQTVVARNQSTLQQRYTVTDAKPLSGLNYYRLAINENGKQTLSKVLTVKVGQVTTDLAVYYAPGSSKLNIRLTGAGTGEYALSLISNAGQLIQSTNLSIDGSEVNKAISLKSGLAKGIYRLVLTNNTSKISKAFIVQ